MDFKYPINVYGFGQYSRLASDKLNEIAVLFGGLFGYIPDPTNLGTTFVNAIANILTTAATDVKLRISKETHSLITSEFTGLFKKGKDENGSYVCEIGTLRFGQSIDLVFELSEELKELSSEDQI